MSDTVRVERIDNRATKSNTTQHESQEHHNHHGQHGHGGQNSHDIQNQGGTGGRAKLFMIGVSASIFIVIMALWVAIWLASPHDYLPYEGTYPYITLIRTVLP